ncbi:leucine-rich repeat domain-containing protein [Polaribacter ponticola]|uniref:Leucine-rich repeat domain-containing protein n=1 Tax=Polaribacter ponticola TaxID=2978475 RepID=A0ABT5SAG2_9FLAO|nr:leucine-rich repeat domain-containing protein [Polaribacter sp. MSW5]MDD7915063.1 leucine-rich repeat domain-containing protein [Polaribacter sp. MSW5]
MKLKLLLFLTLFSLAFHAQVSQTERQALIDLYNATDGDNWTNNTNWDTDPNSTSDVATWQGVTVTLVNGQQHVTRINLNTNNLLGTLPDVTNLSELLRLEIANNLISDVLDITKFPNTLSVLRLSNNALTGSFPDFSSLTNLNVLYLDNLKVTGTVSENNFPNAITGIVIGNNDISGSLDLSVFNSLSTLLVNDSDIDFLKVPNSLSNGLSTKNTPKLVFIESATPANFINLTSDRFDLGLRIVAYDQADKTATPNALEREALKKLYANKSYTYANTIKNGTNDTEWLEIEVINGETRVTEIHTTSLAINGAMPSEIGAFTELTHLHIPSSGINSIATEIKNATKLKELYLNNNSITAIPTDFYDLVNLKILNISNNQIPSLDSKLGDFTSLEELYFSNTQVDVIPTTIGNLKKLQILEFANTKITLLPPEIGGLVELTRLVAAPNSIASIPSEFGQLAKLTYLDFANCELSNTPAAFANLKELETLYLNNNQIQVVAGLGGFTKLKALRLHNNRLGEDNPNFNTDLPEDMSDLVLLEELTLNNNQLKKLPANIGNLIKLTKLPLNTNRLSILPNSIGGLTSLEELNLVGNKLTVLPDEITNITSLKKLELQSNEFTSLPSTIGNLSNLESINVNYQSKRENNVTIKTLTSIPASTKDLIKLVTFYSVGNKITGLVDLSGTDVLHQLNVSDNEISDLKLGGYPTGFQSRSYNVRQNPFITCIEVPTADITKWEAIQRDNGVALSDSCTGFRVPQSEREALIAVYESIGGGDRFTLNNWDTDTSRLTNVGSWVGVTTALIDGQKHVTKLSLSNQDTQGDVSPLIKDLPELTELDLSGSIYVNQSENIQSLPKEIGLLSKLERFTMTYQDLTSLPEEIGDLDNLTYLFLRSNQLTTLPSGIGGMAKLEELYLHGQVEHKSGGVATLTSLPEEIGNIATLKKLELSSNGLISLPIGIGNFASLEELNLVGNKLTVLPDEITNITSLKKLELQSNEFTSLPSTIGNLSNLESINVNYQSKRENNVTIKTLTSIPASTKDLIKLVTFYSVGNKITGLVDLSGTDVLHQLNVSDNEISDLKLGGYPTGFQSRSYNVRQNPFITCIEVPTADITKWEAIQRDNGVALSDSCTGFRVPQSEREALIAVYESIGGGDRFTLNNWDTDTSRLTNVGSWVGVTTALIDGQKHVTKLSLSNQDTQGDVSPLIKDLPELTELDLSGSIYVNQSENIQSLPKEIGLLSKLERFTMTYQDLTSLPEEIGDLDNLTYLFLRSNQLTTLPSGIGGMAKLEELYLHGQVEHKSGGVATLTSLPEEIGNIATLKKLELSSNGLNNIPSSINNLINLDNLNISYNNISGYLNISNLDKLDNLNIRYNNLNGLKMNLSPTAFGGTNGSYSIKLKRNALGCIEVPSDELVSWQLSGVNEEKGYLDNGVIYSDNCSAVTTNAIPDIEREALIALYNNTKGTDWKNDLSGSYNGVTWVADATQKRNVGAWFGVTTAIINGQKHVTKVELNSNKLDGTIPSVIKNLTQLKELDFNNNSVSEIASEIGELTNLEQLTFTSQYNSTNAEYVLKTIPEEINNITSLKRLEMSSNQLEGNLDFSNLVNLTSLHISSNQITGLKIGLSPSVFDNVSHDGYRNNFSFSSNQYLNCIAVPQNTIADWEATTFAQQRPNIVWGLDCSAYNNVPEGEIQALVDMYNNLDGANWTNKTNWTGDLAKATINSPYNATKWQGVTTEIIDGAKHISSISLSNNKLKGEFSASFGNLSKLKYLQMSRNDLSGSIPASFGNLRVLEEIHLNNNQLTSLPSELSNLSNLKTVYFQDNELSGKVPDLSGITSLQTLYLSSNKFQFGDFEDEFTDYQNLTTFIYNPQAKVGVEEDKSFGTSGFTLDAEVNGVNNEYQWYKNGSKITEATNKTLEITEASATDNGYYFCYVTSTVVTGLTIRTENVTLTYDTALSVDNNEFSKAIKLFPNPVNDILQIRNSNNVAINKIEIFNILGKSVQVLKEPKTSINVSSLPKGIYLMNIVTEKGVTIKRIVKK